MRYGPPYIDLGRRQARINDTVVNLTRIEFDLLATSASTPVTSAPAKNCSAPSGASTGSATTTSSTSICRTCAANCTTGPLETNFIVTVATSGSD